MLFRSITAKMKTTLLLLAVIVCASALSTKDKEWEAFKTKFNKQYSAEEDARHFKIFTENKALIAKHNAGETTFKMGINKFADMTTSDTSFLRGYKSDGVTRKDAAIFKPSKKGDDYPDTQDWRNYGYVTGVKDQGQCGSCWSFSATGSLEGQHFAAGNPLVSLSEQNLVDCDDLSFGCNGGNMATAFHYVKTNGGIDSEESYPYEARNGICRYDPADSVATCAGYVALAQSEDDLLGASAEIGPISVAIDASHISFQLYTDGVYDEPNCSSTNLDHGVLVVGYGTYEGTPYWLVKNSWGTSWGIDGYIMMSRNKNNQCGIVTEASYPLV